MIDLKLIFVNVSFSGEYFSVRDVQINTYITFSQPFMKFIRVACNWVSVGTSKLRQNAIQSPETQYLQGQILKFYFVLSCTAPLTWQLAHLCLVYQIQPYSCCGTICPINLQSVKSWAELTSESLYLQRCTRCQMSCCCEWCQTRFDYLCMKIQKQYRVCSEK